MGKDPAFLFYPGDWLGGTLGMSLEMKGAYIELLILQFNTGGFTEDEAKQVLSVRFDYAWPTLQRKFLFEGGYYHNTRLRDEIEKRSKFIESRRLSGLSPKKTKAHAKRTHKRGEDRDENEDISRKRKPFVIPEIEEVAKFFEENGYKPEVGRDKWHYYNDANWFDSKGNPVLNWKQKMRSVWFKEENKINTGVTPHFNPGSDR